MTVSQQIAFRLGKEEFALPILHVQEIIRPRECTEIPESPEYVMGVINLRGRVIPVIDLKGRMMIPRNGNDPSGEKIVVVSMGEVTFGGLVDSITGVVDIDQNMIKESPASLSGGAAEYLKGIAAVSEGRLIQLLDISSLISIADLGLLNEEVLEEENLGDGKVLVTKKVSGIGGDYLIQEVRDKIISGAESKGIEKEVVSTIMEKIQDFLDALTSGDIERAEESLLVISTLGEKELFSEVGKITRNLHNAITEFKTMIDPKLKNMALEEMPDATDKLNWVVTKTEEAAERTIGLVEKNLSLQSEIVKRLDILEQFFQKCEGDCKEQQEALQYLRKVSEEMNVDFMDVILAQEYQDLTGQIIKKTINLVRELEADLVELIKVFGVKITPKKKSVRLPEKTGAEEPLAPEEAETLKSQEDVDSLLQEFGF